VSHIILALSAALKGWCQSQIGGRICSGQEGLADRAARDRRQGDHASPSSARRLGRPAVTTRIELEKISPAMFTKYGFEVTSVDDRSRR
jgi:hypothetical protein